MVGISSPRFSSQLNTASAFQVLPSGATVTLIPLQLNSSPGSLAFVSATGKASRMAMAAAESPRRILMVDLWSFGGCSWVGLFSDVGSMFHKIKMERGKSQVLLAYER